MEAAPLSEGMGDLAQKRRGARAWAVTAPEAQPVLDAEQNDVALRRARTGRARRIDKLLENLIVAGK